MVERRRLASPSGLGLLAAFITTRIVLLYYYVPAATDLRIYFGWVVQAAAGRVAYRDFPIEYPPLAWWVMKLPGTVDRLAYYFRFRALMCAADVIAFVLLAWVVSRKRPTMLAPFAIVYIAATALLGHELYDRLDMGVLFFTAVALFAWVAALERVRRGWWLAAAYAAAGAGTGYKLFPVVFLVFFAMSELLTGVRRRSVLLRVASGVAVAAAPVAITWGYAGNRALGFLEYHGSRGIEIESTWASLMWLLSFAGYPASVVIRYGSWEMAGDAEHAILVASSAAAAACFGALTLWAIVLFRRFDPTRAYLQALLALTALLAVSKVFSPQYLIWAIPAFAVIGVHLSPTARRFHIIMALLVAVAAATTYVYPVSRRELSLAASTSIPNARAMSVLVVRNLICVALWLWFAATCLVRDFAPKRPTPSMAP